MMTKEELIKFEDDLRNLYEDGEIPSLLHFCGGNEDQLIEIFKKIDKDDYVFSTHRTHYHYLLKSNNPDRLKNEILNGDSMFVFDKSCNFLSTSIVAGGPCIAAGISLSIKMRKSNQHVWCFIGDGAEDEGHFYEAVRYVHNMKLPCTFIIEDNNRNISTTKEQRGCLESIDWPNCVERYYYTPTYPHSGLDSKNWIKFKTFQ